jgi:hypothetical protein
MIWVNREQLLQSRNQKTKSGSRIKFSFKECIIKIYFKTLRFVALYEK